MLHLIENAKTPIGLTIPNLRFFAINGESEIKKLKTKTNIFYTIGDSEISGSKRTWLSQKYLPLDFDPTNKTKPLSTEHIETIIQTVCSTLKLEREKTWIIGSGFGVQMMIELDEPISEEKTFKEYKKSYAALCKELNKKFSENNIPAETDSSAFAPNRMMRAPFTLNHKPERGDPKECILISGKNLAPQGSLERLLEPFGSVVTSENNRGRNPASTPMPTTPLSIVKQECAFVKHFLSHPEEVHEPVFRAIIGILGSYGEHNITEFVQSVRLGGSTSSVTTYTDEQVAQKLKEVLEGTKGVGNNKEHIQYKVGYDCPSCPHFTECHRPTAPETAAATGYWIIPADPKLKPRPNYDMLLKTYVKKHDYISVPREGGTADIYAFNGKHYELLEEAFIAGWQEKIMRPSPATNHCNEFISKLKRNRQQKSTSFFYDTTEGKIHLANGYYDSKTDSFHEGHSPKIGFRSTVNIPYDPKATAPRFMEALNLWLGDHQEDIQFLLEFMAYALFNHRPNGTILFLNGEGNNGKSTLLGIIKGLFGGPKGGLMGALTFEQMEGTNLANFEHNLINITDEMKALSFYTKFDDLKNWSAGGVIESPRKYRGTVLFECRCKFLAAGNQNNIKTLANKAAARRICILDFNADIPKDKIIIDFERLLIEEEGPGIINEIIKANRQFVARGFKFKRSADMEKRTADFLIESDPIQRFFETNLEKVSDEEADEICKKLDSGIKNDDTLMFKSDNGQLLLNPKRLFFLFNLECEAENIKKIEYISFARRLMKWAGKHNKKQYGKANLTFLKNVRIIDRFGE